MLATHVALAFRRHNVYLPDWVKWVWVALGVTALVSALAGWWRNSRPADHGSAALARVRNQQRKNGRKP